MPSIDNLLIAGKPETLFSQALMNFLSNQAFALDNASNESVHRAYQQITLEQREWDHEFLEHKAAKIQRILLFE